MGKYKSNKIDTQQIFSNIRSGITSVFVFIILVVFPLYTHDKYFDILSARYTFFMVWTLMLASLLLLTILISFLINIKNFSFNIYNIINNIINYYKNKKLLLFTDIFFVAMMIVSFISYIGTDFKEEAFFGNAGRHQGLQCWFLYFIAYICISRTYKFKMYHLDIAIIAGCFACIWGITDFLWMDIFGFFNNVSREQQAMFASSIGNLNTFTNYTIMIFALSSVLFIIEKNKYKSIFYAIMSLISCAGSIFGLADNTILGFLGFYIFIPFFVFKNRRMFIRYLFTINILFISTFIFALGLNAPVYNKWQNSFFISLIQKSEIIKFIFIPFTIIIILIILGYYIIDKSKFNINNYNTVLTKNISKNYTKIFGIILLIGVLFITYVFLDYNIFKNHVDLWNQLPSSHQLRFNDDWGTHRGHNWRIAFTNFTQNFNIFQKLFGYGPDTYLIVSERTFYQEMVEKYNEVYDSAHNEYINYLICQGVLGLISYLGIFICGIKCGLKVFKNNIYILGPVMAVVCYMFQAFVNIAIPITTPIFFTLMYICVASYVNNNNNNETI